MTDRWPALLFIAVLVLTVLAFIFVMTRGLGGPIYVPDPTSPS